MPGDRSFENSTGAEPRVHMATQFRSTWQRFGTAASGPCSSADVYCSIMFVCLRSAVDNVLRLETSGRVASVDYKL
jgi:hypothetical protein